MILKKGCEAVGQTVPKGITVTAVLDHSFLFQNASCRFSAFMPEPARYRTAEKAAMSAPQGEFPELDAMRL
jgi:hypothetical protein